MKDTLPSEILVSTESPQKRGRGDGTGLFEPQAEQLSQLLWHEDTVCTFEACANEITSLLADKKRPTIALDGDVLERWEDVTDACHFKPEGASSTLCPVQTNANLADLSDGPLKDKKSISIGEKDMEITKSLTRESAVLHSDLLWLTDLLLALTKRLEQPSTVPVVQHKLIKVLQHQK